MMNDYYLDPPDDCEPPECCGDCMDVLEDGTCVCPSCGKRVEPQPDIEPMPEWKCDKCGKEYPCNCEQPFDGPEKCPHGNEWSECAHCDHLSDLAFDSAREARFFR